MSPNTSFVDRVRPLLSDHPIGEQLYVVALLESRSADRYREWAAQLEGQPAAAGLRGCADREDAIAQHIRSRFKHVLAQPADFERLVQRLQAEVVSIFGGHSREEQFDIQAEAERGGERLWQELAAEERDGALKRVLLECARLEAASAEFLEGLATRAARR